MPSLNPNSNFELILLKRQEFLVNPFAVESCQNSCERVLNFLQNIQDKFGNLFLKNQNATGEEFFITMPTIAAFEQQIYLFEAITAHSNKQITDEKIKEFLINFVAAHTVIWQNGIPSAKIGLFGAWTTQLPMLEIRLIENNQEKDQAVVNELQFILIEKLWTRNQTNSIKARQL